MVLFTCFYLSLSSEIWHKCAQRLLKHVCTFENKHTLSPSYIKFASEHFILSYSVQK